MTYHLRHRKQAGSATVIALVALLVAVVALGVGMAALLKPAPVHKAPLAPPVIAAAPAPPAPAPTPAKVTPPVVVQLPEAAPEPEPEPEPEVVIGPEPTTPPAPVAAPPPSRTAANPFPEEGETGTALTPPGSVVPVPTAPAPAAGDVVSWRDAGGHMGRDIVVQGKVIDSKNIGNLTFLNFVKGRSQDFYVVVFSDAYDGVPGGDPEPYYLNKTIRVTGTVSEHKGRAQMKVNDASQITIVK